MKKALSLIIWSLLTIFNAQPSNLSNYCFVKIDSDNGLSQNNVKAIVQDSYGFMWFGTQDKLNRYDGATIKVFECKDPVSKRSNNNISVLFEDKTKKLWVGTDKGIFIFNPVLEHFTFFGNETSDHVKIEDWVADIQSDLYNNIWIVIPNQGLFRYHTVTNKLYRYPIGSSKHPNEGTPQCLCMEEGGRVWIGTNGGGVYLYNPSKDTFTQYLGDQNGSTLKNENIFTMCDYGEELIIGIHEGKLRKMNKLKNTLVDVDAPVHYKIIRKVICINDEIWVGTQDGLYVINEKLNTYSHFYEDPMFSGSLSNNQLDEIYKDRENGIWVSTNFGGVNYLPNRGINFECHVPLSKGKTISSKRIRELKEDKQGNIWIATEDNGLNIYNPKTDAFNQIGRDIGPRPSYYNILGLLLDDNQVWVGYFKNGMDIIQLPQFSVKHYSGKDLNLDEPSVYALCEDRFGKIWLGNAWGVLTGDKKQKKFTRQEQFGFSYIYDIVEDSEGYIWVATMGNGVFKYDQNTGKTEHFLKKAEDTNSLSSNSVSSITESSTGEIWFSTDRGGICRYNKVTRRFTTFSTKDGLPNDFSYKILEDKNHNLWFGTNKGLVKFNPKTKKVKVFTKKDGLPGNIFNYNSALVSSTGKFYFGGLDGMIAFDPYHIKENTFVPPVFITKMTIFNDEIDSWSKNTPLQKSIIHTQKIILRHDQSNIGFEFVALSFTSPSANRYAYKMDNIDKDWIYTNNNHSVSYAKLPPGNYTFRVKGCNNDGLWNEKGACLEIEILPPWWLSKIAQIIYFLLIIFALYSWMAWYKKKSERKHAEKQKLFEIEKEKELYSSKVEFFTEIAHEIRTPVTLINGPLESMLEMEIKDSEIKKNLDIMSRNTNELLVLINQLLDFRKVDGNKFILSFSTTNITDFLKNSYSKFEPLAIQQNKKIHLHLPIADISAAVDQSALTKILNNLFSNAIRYSNQVIEVSIKQEKSFVVIRLRNDGALIPNEMAEKIFDPFYQMGKNKNASSSSGIGLSLARSLAELHHGSLYFKEDEGYNCFVQKLPLEQTGVEEYVPENDNIIEENDKQQDKIHSEIVLVVEDNQELLTFLSNRLLAHFAVEKASNGVEAMKILEEKMIDLVLTDVMMPEMNGFELCQTIKTNLEYSHIPVVLLTAKNDQNSKIKGLQMGADAYVEKPFSFNYLIVQLTNLLNNRRREKHAFTHKPFLSVQQMGINKANVEFMNRAIEIINENITDTEFNVESLGEVIFMSRSNLHRKIKAVSGLSPTDFIRLIRLKKAAEYLQSGKYRVNEISTMVGFSSASYFIKLFQRQFGVTPKEFEKNPDKKMQTGDSD